MGIIEEEHAWKNLRWGAVLFLCLNAVLLFAGVQLREEFPDRETTTTNSEP